MSVFRQLSETQKRSLEFLKSELSDGSPREVVALQKLARSKGIPIRSLTFSRKLLKIEVSRGGQTGAFLWQMPTN